MKTKEQEATKESTGNVIDSDFIPLEDLVYAPLYALAKSNQQLKSSIIESIKSMGKAEHANKEEIIHLDHMNIAYDQVKQDEEGYSVDNLQLEVPLLSIIPMNQLNVDKAEIDFSTEVKAVVDKDNQKTQIQARICSPSQRESDFLPKVSYKLQVQSLLATERILRLIDSLSSSQVAKKLNTRPVAVTGDWGSEEQKRVLNETKKLKAKMNRLKQLYQKINDMIAEQDKLSQISTDCLVADPYDFDKDKYLMAQSNIVNRIMEYQEKIMNLEIKFGLDHDYE